MKLLIPTMAVLLALPAMATGERVQLTPAQHPLQELVCISMTCVKSARGKSVDAVVVAKNVKGAVQFTVKSRSGALLLSHVAPLNDEGELGATAKVTAATKVLDAIENPKPIKQKRVAKKLRRLKNRMLARR